MKPYYFQKRFTHLYLPKASLPYLLFLSICLGGISASLGQGDIIYVDSAATAGGDGTSWSTAYNTLSEALVVGNYAVGDTVWVAKGTYYPTATLQRDSSFNMRNGLVIYGGFLAGATALSQRNYVTHTTTLSGDIGVKGDTSDNSFRVVRGAYADRSAVIDGFTISHGNANDPAGGWVNGGGMYNDDTPTHTTGAIVANCTFSQNFARFNGGAMYNFKNSPLVINCRFIHNTANEGGAIFCGNNSDADIRNCFFTQDSAWSYGGAIHVFMGDPHITSCTFTENYAQEGGAIDLRSNSRSVLVNNSFRGNVAARGGALHCTSGARPEINQSLFSGNFASDKGGAMAVFLASTRPEITNCTFSGNFANTVGGIFLDATSFWSVCNSILYNNRDTSSVVNPGDIASQQISVTSNNLINCLVEDLMAGNGVASFAGDPKFYNGISPLSAPTAAHGDFRLVPSSIAIDAGNNLLLPMDVTDLDEDNNRLEVLEIDFELSKRVENINVDLGAYEMFSLCHPLGSSNQIFSQDTISVCNGDSITLSTTTGGYSSYLWSTTSTNDSIKVGGQGEYWVEVTDSTNCVARDTIYLNVRSIPTPSLLISGNSTRKNMDTVGCQGEVLALRVANIVAPYTIIWSTGVTTFSNNRLGTTDSGANSVIVIDQYGCTGYDTTDVHIFPNPTPTIIPSGATTFCEGNDIKLDAGTYADYKWFADSVILTGFTNQFLTVDTTALYQVQVTDSNSCIARDSILVTVNPLPTLDPITASGPLTFCEGDSVTLDAGSNPSILFYLWSTGDITQTITTDTTGRYKVQVANSFNCISADSVDVVVHPNPTVQIDTFGTTFICKGDTLDLLANANASVSYLWSTGATGSTIRVDTAGTFWVQVTDGNTCMASDTIVTQKETNQASITVSLAPGRSVFCSGDSATLDAGLFANSTYEWSTGALTQRIKIGTGGLYWVKVTYPSSCVDSVSFQINQFTGPLPSITGHQNPLCIGDTANLSVAQGFSTYLWSNSQNAFNIDVTTGGVYRVTVTDANGCVGRDTVVVNQVSLPVPQIDTLNMSTTFCDGNTILLDAGLYAAYLWSTQANSRQITVGTSGQFKVTVTDNNGCEGSDSIQVTVNPNPQPAINPLGNIQFCDGDSVQLDGGSQPTYEWFLNDTTTLLNSTSQITAKVDGLYILKVVDGNGCLGLDSLGVTVFQNPTPTILPLSPFICLPGGTVNLQTQSAYTQYNWTTSDMTPTTLVDQNGIVGVTVTDANGCIGEDTVQVRAFPKPIPIILAGGDTAFCDGDSVTLTANAGFASYLWSTNENTQSITVKNGGTVWVEVTNANGCVGRDSIEIIVYSNPDPTIIATGRIDLCPGSTVQLSADKAYSSTVWSTGATGQSIFVNSAQLITLTVTDGNGCMGADSVNITVSNILAPKIRVSGGSNTLCAGDTVNLSVGMYSTYAWFKDIGGTISQISTLQSAPIFEAGTYWVQVTDGACTGADTIQINVVQQLNVTISPPGNISVCDGTPVILDAGGPYAKYDWLTTGDTTRTIQVTQTDLYTVVVEDSNGCTGRVSKNVQFNPVPTLGITTGVASTEFCDGDSVLLYAGAYPVIAWSTNSFDDSIYVKNTGSYHVAVTDTNGCIGRDTIQLTFYNNPIPQISPGGPIDLCVGDTLTLSTGTFSSYLWSNGDITQTINDTLTGIYWVNVTDSRGCEGRDTVMVNSKPLPNLHISPSGPVTICPESSVIFDAGPFQSYQWSNGKTTRRDTIQGQNPGIYSLTVTDLNGCKATQSVQVNAFSVDSASIVTDPANVSVACSNDSITLNVTGNFSHFAWNTTDTTRTIHPFPGSNLYTVIATDSNNCQKIASAFITVHVSPIANFTGLDTASFCDNDTDLVQLVTMTQGSSFIGPGIVFGTFFNPSVAGAGVHTITYILEDQLTGCKDSVSKLARVFPAGVAPVIHLPKDTLCDNVMVDTLKATPFGGKFEGLGISSFGNGLYFSFNPDTLQPGWSYLKYTYDVGLTCDTVTRDSIYILPTIPLNITGLDSTYCVDANADPFSFSPAGGLSDCATCGSSWLIAGRFIPSNAGIGTHVISYDLPTASCTSRVSKTVQVFDRPQIRFGNTDHHLCKNEPPIPLIGIPAGGTFLGNGIVNNSHFDPKLVSVGMHILDYLYEDPNTDCQNIVSDTFYVDPLPQPRILGIQFTPYCPKDDSVVLNANIPGGFFSGPGIRDSNIFDPSIARIGPNLITYSVTDMNGCVGVDSLTATVDSVPIPIVTSLTPIVCENESRILLTATPQGGTFSGTGVLAGRFFEPDSSGLGIHTVTYSYTTPGGGCLVIIDTTIEVASAPVTSFHVDDSTMSPLSPAFCLSQQAVRLIGVPSGGAFSGQTITGNIFNPAEMPGPGLDTISYVYIDPLSGCSDTATTVVGIQMPPPVSIIGWEDSSLVVLCPSDPPLTFVGDPSGGSFWLRKPRTTVSVNTDSVSTFTLFPALADTGQTQIRYIFDNGVVGCRDSARTQVIVFGGRPVTWHDLAEEYCVSAPDFALSASAQGGLSKGYLINGGSAAIFRPSILLPGTHTVGFIYEYEGCLDTVYEFVTVRDRPSLSISGLQDSYCATEQPDPLFGTPGGGLFAGAGIINSPFRFSPTNSGIGTHVITYTYADGIGCENSISDTTIVLTKPNAAFMVDEVCLGEPSFFQDLTFPSGPPYTYQWAFGDEDSAFVKNPGHVYDEPRPYQVSMIASLEQCKDTALGFAYVLDIPKLAITGDTTVFLGDSAYFTNLSDTSTADIYTLRFALDDVTMSFDQEINYLFRSFGQDTVWLTAFNSMTGCIDSIYHLITIESRPRKDFEVGIYPNPILPSHDPQVFINIEVVEGEEVKVFAYDRIGREVRSQHYSGLSEGLNRLQFDFEGLPEGLYALAILTGTELDDFGLIEPGVFQQHNIRFFKHRKVILLRD